MAHTLPLDVDGCLTLKATSAITTPFVFLKWDTSNAYQVVVATDEEDAPAGVLMHAVAAGDSCKVFAQRGGIVQVAMSAAAGTAHSVIIPTTGGYGLVDNSTDGNCAWAMNVETGGAQYDIISCVYFGGMYVPDVTMWSAGS